MSTADKTRQQLVDTMRKTKAAAAGKTAAVNKAPRPVRRKVKNAKEEAAATSTGKHTANATGGSRSVTSDSYQTGRRVWPD